MTVDNQRNAAGPREGRTVSPVGQLRLLQGDFAQRFAARGGALTGCELTVTSGGWARQSYADFLAAVAEHTCCHILVARAAAGPGLASGQTPPGPLGHVWLEMQRGLAFAMVDALLGGNEGVYIPDRALTGVERGILRHVIDVAAECLGEAWSAHLAGVSFEVLAADSPAVSGGLGHVDQPVTVLTLHQAMSDQAGTLRLCLPQSLLSPGLGGAGRPCGPVEISVDTDEVTLWSSDLADMSVGDILTTETPAGGEVIVRVAGIPKFRGRLGTCNGRRAVTITRRISDPPAPVEGS